MRTLLLIVSAIQGITPDARDIASSLAMRILSQSLPSPCGVADQDDSPDEICDVVHDSRTWVVRKREAATRPAHFAAPGAFAECPTREIAPGRSSIAEMGPGHDLSLKLCRLVC
jgi:hypothetical protein